MAQDHTGGRERRVGYGQNQLLFFRRHLSRQLVSDEQLNRVSPRSQFHILPVKDVVGGEFLVLLLGQRDIEAATQSGKNRLRPLPEHAENLELRRLLIALALELDDARRHFKRQRHDVITISKPEWA